MKNVSFFPYYFAEMFNYNYIQNKHSKRFCFHWKNLLKCFWSFNGSRPALTHVQGSVNDVGLLAIIHLNLSFSYSVLFFVDKKFFFFLSRDKVFALTMNQEYKYYILIFCFISCLALFTFCIIEQENKFVSYTWKITP